MPDSLTTPLHAWHEQNGAKLVDFAGWTMPIQYTSIVTEHQATRNAATLFDVSHMGRFQFNGPAAVNLLDGLLTRRVSSLKPGNVRYSMITNDDGKVLDDVLVSRYPIDNSYGLVVNASNREKLLEWISPRIGNYDVQFEDETTKTAMIAVQGPRAIEVVDGLVTGMKPSDLAYYEVAFGKWEDTDITVSRTGYTGEDGVELTVPANISVNVWETLMETITPLGGCAAGLGARDTLRLEAGMPLYGHELSEELTPFDAGLGFAVQLKDREFPGSELLKKAKEQPSQERVGLKLDGKRVPREHYPVCLGEKKIGEVSSGTFSPTFNHPIAMAMLSPGVAKVGDELNVDIRGKLIPAKVVELPFYKRT